MNDGLRPAPCALQSRSRGQYARIRISASMRTTQSLIVGEAGAKFSSCRRWRYLLWRRWDPSLPVANFLMLNPSTADERVLDPTCTRARRYVERWGYGALIVTNVFGWRATDPAGLRQTDDPVGPGNDGAILRAAAESELLVCAWGNHALLEGRSAAVRRLLREAGVALHALRLNANGEPAHPLYLPGSLEPAPWEG